MLTRLFVSNFKCLLNFELNFVDPTFLLMGLNGSGKSSAMKALFFLKEIARGENYLKNLILPEDFGFQGKDVPMRFEIDVELKNIPYT